jgi:autotransporter-associated beta strand protein
MTLLKFNGRRAHSLRALSFGGLLHMVFQTARNSRKRLVTAVALASAVMGPVSNLLADRTWDRGAGTNFWTDPANWNPDGLPTSADTAIFTDTGAGTVDLNLTDQPSSGSFVGVTFNNATTGYTLQNGGTLFTNKITSNAGAAVINTISAQVTVSTGLTLNSGTLVLSNGNNSIAGPSTIAAGAKLDILAPGSNTIGNVTLNGGTLVVRGGVQVNNGQLQQLAYKGIFGQNRLNPISTGTGALAQTPTFTDSLSGPLSFSDAQLNTIGGQNDNYTIVWRGDVTVATAGTYSLGTASDDGSVVYIDLNHDGIFDPATELILNSNFDQGITQRTFAGNLPAGKFGIAIGYYENGGGAGMEARILDGNDTNYANQTVLDPSVGTANLSFSYTQTFDANLSGTNITVTAANSVVDMQSATGTVGNIAFNSGTSLTVQGMVGANAVLGNLSGTGTATLNTSITTTAGTLSGFTVFTKGGTGTLNLGDSPSFNGQIVVSGGTLLASSTNALGSTTGNTVVQSGGQLSLRADGITEALVLNGTGPGNGGALESGVDNNSRTFAGPISLGSDAFIVSSTGGKTLTLTGGVATAGFQARFGGNGDIIVNTGAIAGTGGIRKTEGGTLTLNVASTYTGVTQVDAGTLAFTAPLSSTSTINLTNGTINAGAAINAAAAVNVTGGTYNANATGSLAGSTTIGTTGVVRVTTAVGAGGSINVNAGGELRFDAATTGLTTTTNNINVNNGGVVRSTAGIADLSTQNIVVVPRNVTNNANQLRAIAINSTAFDPTTGTNVNNVLNLTPTVTSTLPNGSGAANNGAINFPQASGDGRFNSFFGATLNDQITVYFNGRFTAPTTGSYQFRITDNDDTGTVALDMNENQSFADGVDKLATIGCCNNDTNITVNLTAGQTVGVFYGLRDTGGGSGLVGHFTLPNGTDTLVTPGDPAQAGLWSFQTSTGGGTVQVDFGSELRARTITGATNLNLNSGTLTLTAGTVGSPLASSADNLTVSGGSTLNVGANHTLTIAKFSAVSASLGIGTLTKTGAGTLTVTGSGTTTLDNAQIVANAGVMDLGQMRVTSTVRNTVVGLQGRLYVNNLVNPINNAAGVMNLINTAVPNNIRVLDSANGPNGGVDFRNDVDLANFFNNNNVSNATGQPNNNYTVVFTGNFTPTTTGTQTFGIGLNDDNTAVFVDANRNGTFEASEQVVSHICCNNNNTDFTSGTVNLTAGQTYAYAIVNEDTGGGGSMTAKITDASTVVVPGGANQGGTWSFTTGGGGLQVDPGATLVVGGTDAPLGATVNGTLRYASQVSATANALTSLTVSSGQTGTLDIQTNQTLTIASGSTMALSGNLVKTGAGRLAINAATSGTGSISVTGGTLGGTGSIAGPLSVAGPVGSGGTVAPGNSVGTLSSGNFTVSSAGGTLGIELDPTNSGGLGTSDNLNVTGTVALTGGNLALSILSLPTVGQQFQIITNDGSDPVVGTFTTANGNPIVGNSFTVSGDTFSINYAGGTGNDVVLTATAVPEPAAIGTIGLAALGLLARRRRRRG